MAFELLRSTIVSADSPRRASFGSSAQRENDVPLPSGRVLVTDGNERAALALTRSLGRSGRHVVVGATRRGALAGASRFAAAEVQLPDPLGHPAEFAAALRTVVRRHAIDVVLPVSEASLLAILPIADQLRPAIVPFASAGAFRQVCDKSSVLALAREMGIATPSQVHLEDREACGGPALLGLRFPVVVKPARSVGEAAHGRVKLGIAHAASEDALRRVLDRLPDAAFPVLVQQRIVGPGIGVFLLVWDGRVRARFAHRRLREKPPSGGVSVYSESTPLDPSLAAVCEQLLRRFAWRGVAMIEFKRDAATGTPYMMEINGRFWGSLELAIAAGVDFPRLLVELATGASPDDVTTYELGVRNRWWWGDVDALIARWRRVPDVLALPPDAPSRWRHLCAVARIGRGDRNEILQWDDPMPFLRETRQWLRLR
jgi:predicted ATP-grasp superfamily ATP-dependent carboligase